jgi:ABC-type uncharacterized transport system involved in gliding motility auxiliary subunit
MELTAMNARTGRRRSLVLLALSIAVLAAGALVLDRFHLVLDLSSDRRYSISAFSRDYARKLPDTLSLTYYVSPEIAARHPAPRQVEDFLRKFAQSSRGRVSFTVADPRSKAGALESLGLKPQRMQVIEKNEARVAVVYSGIVAEYAGRTEVLPWVLGLSTLEYDLVKAMDRAVSGKAAVAAVLVGDADKSWENDFRSLAEALTSAGWTPRPIQSGEAVPPEARVLIVLGNAALDDYAAYRVDSWLASGGAALLALRGVDIQTNYGLQALPLKDDAIIRAAGRYGLVLAPELVLDQSSRTLPFQQEAASGAQDVRYVKYPLWIVARGEDTSGSSPITSSFGGLDLPWSSPLSISAPAGVRAEALVKTSKAAWLQTKDFAIAPEDEGRYAAEQEKTRGQYLLAASLEGVLPMAYAGLTPPSRPGAPPLPPLPAAAKAARLVVVGSADFATDIMSLTDSGYNAFFAANAVEWAAYGPELAALKARGASDYSLTKVADPLRRSGLALFAIILNVVLLPGGLALMGLVRFRRRRAADRPQEAAPAEPPDAVQPVGPGRGASGKGEAS